MQRKLTDPGAFPGCESSLKDARIVLFGAPFDSTTSFRPGARFAPQTMRSQFYGLESWSPYLARDLEELSVHDAGDLDLAFGNPARAVDAVEAYACELMESEKIPCMIGGEHLLTLGAVRAAAKKHSDLCILHFDAHADLRADYMGEELSHATVLRRCWELTGDDRIFQFGIRSGDREEFLWGREHVQTTLFGFEGLSGAVQKMGDRPVYFTLDLDVLDPSVFPGTGTPEPGGVSFQQLMEAVRLLSGLRIVGFDIMELSPPYDPAGISTAAACKMLRELLLLIHP